MPADDLLMPADICNNLGQHEPFRICQAFSLDTHERVKTELPGPAI